jgi:hypothetical protein
MNKILYKLIKEAQDNGVDIQSPEFQLKLEEAKEYLADIKERKSQKQLDEYVASIIKEISQLKFEPQINIPDIKVPEVKVPDNITVKDIDQINDKLDNLNIPGIPNIEDSLGDINQTTQNISKILDYPIPVVLTDPAGNEYTASGGGGGNIVTKNLAKEAKQDDMIAELNSIAGLGIPAHDYISLSYTGANLTGVVYKTGGSGGTTVATLTLGYDIDNNLTSVTKS